MRFVIKSGERVPRRRWEMELVKRRRHHRRDRDGEAHKE